MQLLQTVRSLVLFRKQTLAGANFCVFVGNTDTCRTRSLHQKHVALGNLPGQEANAISRSLKKPKALAGAPACCNKNTSHLATCQGKKPTPLQEASRSQRHLRGHLRGCFGGPTVSNKTTQVPTERTAPHAVPHACCTMQLHVAMHSTDAAPFHACDRTRSQLHMLIPSATTSFAKPPQPPPPRQLCHASPLCALSEVR